MATTAIITGASQGIGKATAIKFASKGYNLVLAARRTELLTALAQELSSNYGIKAIAIPTDVRDAAQVGALIEKALLEFGAIDVLINNAGIYISGPVEEFSLEDWHQVIDTNLWGYIHTIQALLPSMVKRGKGIIINLASIGGAVPLAYLVPYSTTKFAIDGLTQSLHSELAPKGIHVGGVYPNLIKTSFLERAIFRGKDETDRLKRIHQVEQSLENPLVEKPNDVANAVWDAVEHRKERVFVGSAKVAALSNAVVPQLIRLFIRKTFQNNDSYKGAF